MKGIRRKEKEIKDRAEMIEILKKAQHITTAMCDENEPYLVTLSHGYDDEKGCIYFHCAKEGKKIDILNKNNRVWGQALVDLGYVQGACDHLYATTQFRGRVTFITDTKEKEHALTVMIHGIDDDPAKVISEQITKKSVKRVNICRIDIDYMSGKKATEVVIQT
ncbi:MAG: pyridoxamine 5'-phosphate oxidase family protein [Candidatus Thorarchaeota archaeon]|jgi:nitroimidazol reductase NimA-like FMN-containing flavoprotein (pyridoxamine 5'-phosphate oxidase superfamily)